MRIPFFFLIVFLFLTACDSNSEPEELVKVMLKEGRTQFLDLFRQFGTVDHETLSANEITVREFPRVVFTFPLELRQSWESLRDPRFSLVITGEVIGVEDVEVPAGMFQCLVVKTTHTFQAY